MPQPSLTLPVWTRMAKETGWGLNSVVDRLPSKCKVLEVPSSEKKKKEEKRKKKTEKNRSRMAKDKKR